MAKARVLIVEDDVDSNEALRLLLVTEDYEVYAAFNAQQAVALAAEHIPNLAFIDIGLPAFSGIDLLRALRAMHHLQQCRYVALTGYDAPSLAEEARVAGFERFLLKPVASETLLRTASALLGDFAKGGSR